MNKTYKIVIVGGGTAGWFAAAAFSKIQIFNNIEVVVIEAPNVPRIGVGESVTPHVQAFFNALEIPQHAWMAETGAIYKYANKFIGWKGGDEAEHFSFSYPFDVKRLYKEQPEPLTQEDWNLSSDSYTTLDLFARYYSDKKLDKFDKYFDPQYHYMNSNVAPFDEDRYLLNPLLSWSQHINAEKCADYMKDHIAIPKGVIHIQKFVKEIVVSKEDTVDHLILDDGEIVQGDLYLDATGFHKLITRKLGWGEKIYKENPVDRAWVCQLDYEDPQKEMVNYTQSIAQPHGWLFKIGLYHRMGTGYCFSSSHVSDEQALEHYKKITNNHRKEPRLIKWTPSRLEKMASGNVVALGLSAGFVEPMEANALYIIITSIRRLMLMIRGYQQTGQYDYDTFNKKMSYTIDDIADFIKVHYTLSTKDETDFWKDMRILGDKENHQDILMQKYTDPRNTMNSAQDGWTLFPDYMWLQLAISWGFDVSNWPRKDIDPTTYELGLNYFKNLEQKNKIISQTRMNNHDWLKKYVFQDLTPNEWETKFLQ